MKRFGRKYQKRLAKLVTVALMCTGGGLFSLPHVASAAEVKEVTWDGSLTSSQTPTNVTPDNAAMELSGTPKVYAHITDTYVTQGYKTLTLIPGGTTVYVMAGYNNTKDALSGFTLNFNGGIWNYSYGAFSEKGGNVTENKVYINGGKVVEVDGGRANVAGNVKDNEVHIEDGNITDFIYGGYSANGNSDHNTVTINGGTISGEVFGGRSINGAAINNNVNILGGTTTFNKIYGGRGGATSNNHVNIGKDSTAIFGYGSAINGGSGTGDVENNTVTISGTLTPKPGEGGGIYIYGGLTDGSNGNRAYNNSVTITGNAAINTDEHSNGWIYGGSAGGYTGSNATENTVTISGNSTLGNAYWLIYGGSATKAANNKVIIDGGTVYGVIYGGTGAKAANDNKVIIDGGTVNASIYGGSAGSILLGYEDSEASGNTVTIGKDATLSSDTCIYGGSVVKTEFDPTTHLPTQVPLGTANNNTVNILKAISVLHIMGGEGATSTGNTLNIGATGVTVGDLGIAGFQTIALTTGDIDIGNGEKAASSLKFEDGAPVLSSGSFMNADGSNFTGTLDITNTDFTGTGTMKLLASGTNDNFATLKLAYDDATKTSPKTLDATTPSVVVKSSADGATAELSLSNKVVLTTGGTHTVSLDTANSSQNVLYTIESNGNVSKVDLKNWDGATYNLENTYTGSNVPVATGSFTAPVSTKNILNAPTANFFGEVTGDRAYTSGAFTPVTSKGVTISGNKTGGVKVEDSGKTLKYYAETMGVQKVALGAMTWNDGLAASAGYGFAGVTTLDASGLAFDKPENVNADMNLVTNAAGIPAGMDATAGKDHSQSFEQTAKNNVKLTANLKGTVTTDTNVVKYVYGGKELTQVDLKDWNGSDATFDATGWTKGASAVVETAGLSVTVDPGVEKTVLTVSDVDLTGITVNGEAYQWKDGGDSIAETSAENGVKITAGETTGGGIKGDGNKIIYKGSSKTVTGLEVTSVDFVKGGMARAFKNDYDLTNAAITAASDISVTNTTAMNPGDTMVVVDATNAIKVAGKEKQTLKDFTTINAGKAIAFTDQIEGKSLKLSGMHQDTLEQNADQNQILYKVGEKNVTAATFTGEVAWNDSEAYYTNDTTKYKFSGATNVDADALKVTGDVKTALKKNDSMTLLSATGMTAGTVTPQSDANKEASKITVNYSDAISGIAYGAEAKGAVVVQPDAVKYNINEVKVKTVDLADWNGTAANLASGDTSTWTADDKSVVVNNADAITVTPTATQAIVTAGSGIFKDVNVAKTPVAFDPVTENGVTITGTQTNSIQTTKTKVDNDTISYVVGKKDVESVAIGAIEWGGKTLNGSSADYNYESASVDSSKFDISNPEKVEANVAKTLLKANDSLKDMAKDVNASYNDYQVTTGVLMNGKITGKLSKSGNNVVFTATENKATELKFEKVEWTGDTALIDHSETLTNVSFDGATVDTSGIDFYKEMYIEADQTTTLVDGFDGKPGEIKDGTYLVGTAYEGEGTASVENGKLIYRTTTAAGLSEQTHKTVMAMEAGMALLASGGEHVGKALEGLGDAANRGPDGTSVGVSIGGSGNRYETGSHVNVNAWNAVVAVGAKRELKQGALEYGVFGEYGKGSYKLYNDDGGKGDGDAHYAGGGLMAKWTNKHDVYAEASFRLGRMSDSADNILEGGGNKYGYDVHANYYGAHVGIGKVFNYKGGKSLDVYGKYFYTKRDGVEYDAKQHYNLDSVASSVLRIGARYGTTDKKWNWYGGLAYEYEFDGEAKGTVNGTEIRAASIKGSSVRGEFGMRMDATKDNPWRTDISIYGYGGKHRGFGGSVNVAYTF